MEDNITSRLVPFLVFTFENDPNNLTTMFYMMQVSDIIDANANAEIDVTAKAQAKAAAEAKTEAVVKAASVGATAAAA